MAVKFTNNASATLAASINTSVTTITVSSTQGALFPSLSGADYFYATLVDASNNLEIVKVTARSTDTLTVVRGQDGTTARSFTAGDKLELRPVAAALNELVSQSAAATTSTSGVVQLNSAVNSTSEALAATPKAVKTAYDAAVAAQTKANTSVQLSGDQSVGGVKTFTGTHLNVYNSGATYNGIIYLGNTRQLRQAADDSRWEMVNAANTDVIFTFADNGDLTAVGDIYAVGDITATGDVTAYSDERLKKDWAPVCGDFVSKLAGVKSGTYTRIDNDDRQAGVAAQRLQEVLPETVKEDVEGYLSVAYGNAALVSAIELAKKVVELQKRLEVLEAK